MSEDLWIGLWMDDFKRPPWELGFGDKKDIALMSRARHAVFVYQTAQQCRDPQKMQYLSEEQMELVVRMREMLKTEKRATSARPTRFVRRRRAPGALNRG